MNNQFSLVWPVKIKKSLNQILNSERSFYRYMAIKGKIIKNESSQYRHLIDNRWFIHHPWKSNYDRARLGLEFLTRSGWLLKGSSQSGLKIRWPGQAALCRPLLKTCLIFSNVRSKFRDFIKFKWENFCP